MRCHHLKTWILLVYLVLLWNLGPSVHRAHFFGFHSHCHDASCESVSCHGDSNDGVYVTKRDDSNSHRSDSCNTCGLHAHAEIENVDSDSAKQSECGTHAPHDQCSVCKFFDEFNLVVSAVEQPIDAVPCVFYQVLHTHGFHSQPLVATARGPPLFIA